MSLARIARPLAQQLKQTASPATQQSRSFAKVPAAKGTDLVHHASLQLLLLLLPCFRLHACTDLVTDSKSTAACRTFRLDPHQGYTRCVNCLYLEVLSSRKFDFALCCDRLSTGCHARPSHELLGGSQDALHVEAQPRKLTGKMLCAVHAFQMRPEVLTELACPAAIWADSSCGQHILLWAVSGHVEPT